MTKVDLCFPVQSTAEIPADHGYLLYGALSRQLPSLHADDAVGIHPIAGQIAEERKLALHPRSRLKLRLDAEWIPEMLPLVGEKLRVGGVQLTVGAPQVEALRPSSVLRSRLVTIKLADGRVTEASFLAAIRRKFAAFEVAPLVEVHLGKQRTLRIKEKEILGYDVLVEGLSAEESLTLQERGLGGRRHMGCGIFTPFNPKEQ